MIDCLALEGGTQRNPGVPVHGKRNWNWCSVLRAPSPALLDTSADNGCPIPCDRRGVPLPKSPETHGLLTCVVHAAVLFLCTFRLTRREHSVLQASARSAWERCRRIQPRRVVAPKKIAAVGFFARVSVATHATSLPQTLAEKLPQYIQENPLPSEASLWRSVTLPTSARESAAQLAKIMAERPPTPGAPPPCGSTPLPKPTAVPAHWWRLAAETRAGSASALLPIHVVFSAQMHGCASISAFILGRLASIWSSERSTRPTLGTRTRTGGSPSESPSWSVRRTEIAGRPPWQSMCGLSLTSPSKEDLLFCTTRFGCRRCPSSSFRGSHCGVMMSHGARLNLRRAALPSCRVAAAHPGAR